MNITILGAGSFGLALAKTFQNNNITIWSKFKEEENNIKNKKYIFTTNLEEALNNKDIIIIAIPINHLENTLLEIKKYYHKGIIIIASKGINENNNKFAYQSLENILPTIPYGILSGGTFAQDMLKEQIMGITLATKNKRVKNIAKKYLENQNLKIEITNDIIGTSLCGAIKNVLAIASGMIDSMNYKESTKFMFLTESILETKRLIKELGGNKSTILSYAGIDDLMLTCTSTKSRNYTFGTILINKKEQIEDYKNKNTIEGLGTTKALYNYLKEKNIASQLINIIYRIIYENDNPNTLIKYLETLKK